MAALVLGNFVIRLFAGFTYRCKAVPFLNIGTYNKKFTSNNNDPQFLLRYQFAWPPRGWVRVRIAFPDTDQMIEPVIYFDTGNGFTETQSIRFSVPPGLTVDYLFWLPMMTRKLRLDPVDKEGLSFGRPEITIREFSWPGIVLHMRNKFRCDLFTALKLVIKKSKESFNLSLENEEVYQQWRREYHDLTQLDYRLIRAHLEAMEYKPLITITLPVYNPDIRHFRDAIESVICQLYTNWELCIVDDHSTNMETKELLEHYKASDPRIRLLYRGMNGGIAAATNDAISMATGEFIALMDQDDLIEPHALYLVCVKLNEKPGANLIYTDSDHMDTNGRLYNPFFKPDWNYDYMMGANYLNHLTVIRTASVVAGGGFRPGFEGSQDYDLYLRIIEKIPQDTIEHIPFILYHWRIHERSFSNSNLQTAIESSRLALNEHLARSHYQANAVRNPFRPGYHRVIWDIQGNNPLVSIVIPTRDRVEMLAGCISGILERTDYKPIEVIIVDNGSLEDKTHQYFESIHRSNPVRIIKDSGPFNYSRLCNFGVRCSKGNLICLLNNDISIINPTWLTELVSHALRENVGVTGAKLYFADNRIQHAGVILGIRGVAGHIYKYVERKYPGDHARLQLTQNLSAVTGACMIFKRSVFDHVEGLDEEHLSVAFNDVDFCLRVRNAGYKIVWTPFAELYHLESATRGQENNSEKKARFKSEVEYMVGTWGEQLTNDPYFNSNLSLDYEEPIFASPPRTVKPWVTHLKSNSID